MMRYGKLGALVLALVFLLPAGAAAQKQVDWPQFQFDAGKTGYNSFEKVINKDNVADLTEAWGYNLDGESGSSFSSPVAQGKIYVSFDTELGGLLYALDAFTGETVWPLEDPLPGNIGYIRSAPAVGKGVVYAVNHLGDLYALDADSGQTLWSCSIDDRQFYEDRPSSPTVAGNRVYVSSEDGTLFAFHGKSGRLLWDYQVYSGYLGSCSSPAVAGGLVYVCSDYELHAVKAATGAPKWTFASPAWLSFPVVAQGKVFVGGGRLVALNARTGQELWTYSPGGGVIFESPAVAKGVVYAIDISGRVHALKAATGQVLWVSEQLALYLDFAAPTVANGVVYVGGVNIFSPNGIIFAIDAATGAKLWEYPLDLRWPPFYISPAVVNGMVYTPTCAFKLGN